MNPFEIRTQSSSKSGNVSAPRSCQWLEVKTSDFRLMIDGTYLMLDNRIIIETEDKKYSISATLLLSLLERHQHELVHFKAFKAEPNG